MFTAFMWSAAKTMGKPMKDGADVRPTEKDGVSGDSAWKSFALHNAQLSKMVQDIQNTGLGSLEDVYLCVIPPLSMENRLPRADAIIEWARAKAKPHELLGRWKKAGDAYLWLFRNAKTFPGQDDITTKATALLMEYLRAVTNAIGLRKAQLFEENDIQDLEELKTDILKELQGGSVKDVLRGIMGLYDMQGRSWVCELVEDSNPPKGKDTVLKFTELHMAAAQHDRWWDIEGAIKESNDIRGQTPLHYAACRQDGASIIHDLLRKGAEINIRDVDGIAPLHNA
ncbi:hypothetical protein N656DRAFT_841569, partial [Canariomyces notabilis]